MARRSLLCSSPVHRIIHVEDGQAALDYLHRKNAFENLLSEPLPDLILLDLNMPKMGGFEVLRQIRENQELRKIPSVVLTTSADPMDKEDALRLGAAGFQTKPMSPESFTELLGNFPCNLLSFS
jgi:CheY-like chemotaxis protein